MKYLPALLLLAVVLLAQTVGQVAQTIIVLPDVVETEVDELSYQFLKSRQNPVTLPIPLPSLAYAQQGNIKLVVFAIPYVPQKGEESALSAVFSAVKNINWQNIEQTNWGNVVGPFLVFRNVMYPYEAFKVKLVFVMFITTQDLMSLAGSAMKEALSGSAGSSSNGNPEVIYAEHIFTILRNNYNNNLKSKLEELKNSYKSEIDKIILKEDTDRIIITLNDVNLIELTTFHSTTEVTDKECALILTYGVNLYVYEQLNNIIPPQNDIINNIPNMYINKYQIKKVFPGIDDEKASSLAKQLNNSLEIKVKEYVNQIYNSFYGSPYSYWWFGRSIAGSIFEKLGLSTSYSSTTGDYYVVRYQQSLKFAGVNVTLPDGGWYCDFTDARSNAKQAYENFKENIKNKLKVKFNEIKNDLKTEIERWYTRVDGIMCFDRAISSIRYNVVTEFKDSLKGKVQGAVDDLVDSIVRDSANALEQGVADIAKACITKFVNSAMDKATGAVVGSIPGVNLIYTIANGIFGALQKQVVIKIEVFTKDDIFTIYNVSRAAACYSRLENVRGTMESWPSATEALFAGILGFVSAIVKQYTDSNVVDLVPIIREVDVPIKGYYFMVPSRPGIYYLQLRIEAKSIIDQFLNNIKEGIKQSLSSSVTYNCELAESVAKALRSWIAENSNTLKFQAEDYTSSNVETYSASGDQCPEGKLCLNITLVTISPYMVGRSEGSFYNYSLALDVFSMLRSYQVEFVSNLKAKYMEGPALFPNQRLGSFLSLSIKEGVVTSVKTKVVDSCTNIIKDIVDKHFDKILSYIKPQPYTPSCDIESFAGVMANALLDVLHTTVIQFKEGITDYASSNICNPLGDRIGGAVGDAIGKVPFLDTLLAIYPGGFASTPPASVPHVNRFDVFTSTLETGLRIYLRKLLNSIEDASYLPSYFLTLLPISVSTSPTAEMCYSVVALPYFAYYYNIDMYKNEESFKKLLINSLDIIRTDNNLKGYLINYLKERKLYDVWTPITCGGSCPVYDTSERKVLCNDFAVYRHVNFLFFNYDIKIGYYKLDDCIANRTDKFTLVLNKMQHDINDQNAQLLLENLVKYVGARNIYLPTVVGFNKYFSAIKIKPVVRVMEPGDPNPYYFQIPYSAPARELYILGRYGNVIAYDGGTGTELSGKPVYFVNLNK